MSRIEAARMATMTMANCPNCNATVPRSAKVCPKCGRKIKK